MIVSLIVFICGGKKRPRWKYVPGAASTIVFVLNNLTPDIGIIPPRKATLFKLINIERLHRVIGFMDRIQWVIKLANVKW